MKGTPLGDADIDLDEIESRLTPEPFQGGVPAPIWTRELRILIARIRAAEAAAGITPTEPGEP